MNPESKWIDSLTNLLVSLYHSVYINLDIEYQNIRFNIVNQIMPSCNEVYFLFWWDPYLNEITQLVVTLSNI